MKLQLVFAVLCAVLASSHALTEEEIEVYHELTKAGITPRMLEDQIQNIIDKIKDMIKNGNPEKGIPPMDPYKADHQSLNLNFSPIIAMNGKAENVLIQNLAAITTEKLSFKITPIELILQLKWDPVSVDASLYECDGNIINLVPVFGYGGPVELGVDSLTVSVHLKVKLAAGKFSVESLEVEIGIYSAKCEIPNFMGGTIGDVFCEVVKEDGARIIDYATPVIMPMVLKPVTNCINEYLQSRQLSDIMADINNGFAGVEICPKDNSTVSFFGL